MEIPGAPRALTTGAGRINGNSQHLSADSTLLRAELFGAFPTGPVQHELTLGATRTDKGQDPIYQASVIGETPIRVAVEAGVRQGWDRFIGPDGLFVGMKGFGASAPYERLYKEFGITADAVVEAAKAQF